MLPLLFALHLTAADAVPAWKRDVAAAAPRGAIDCGVGCDEGSDAAVERCGREAVALRRAFYCVFLPWPGPASDVITSPHQMEMGYAGDGRTVAAVTLAGRRTSLWPAAAAERPLRGMHLPRFAIPTPPASRMPGTVIVEALVSAGGQVSARVLKSAGRAADARALHLVEQSVLEPARIFGLAVPVMTTVLVDSGDDKLASIAPRAIGQLPPAIRKTLHARGCRIPESGALGDAAQNVARGHFTAARSDDWAVLCLAGNATRIVVFRGDSGNVFAELARRPLDQNLTGERQPDGTFIFDRLITPVTPGAIRRTFAYRGEKPPRLTHDGIDDAGEKASTVWYYAEGRWLAWPGSD